MKNRTPSRPRSRHQQRRSFFDLWKPTIQTPASRKLRVEALEDRRVLTMLYVDQTPTIVGPGADTFTTSGGSQATTGGLTLGTNLFTTVTDAFNAAADGDTINIADGTFTEFFGSFNKTLTVRGNQFGVDARTRPGTFESILNHPQGAFNVTASNVVIDGLTIQDGTNTAFLGFAIGMGNGTTTGTQVLNNIIKNSVAGVAVSNTGASQVVIRRNLFASNNQGTLDSAIYSDQFVAGGAVSNVLITENEFTGHSDAGINLSSTVAGSQSNFTISNNEFDGNGRALVAFNLVNSSFTGNELKNATFAASADIRLFEGVSNFVIANNLMQNGAGRGVRISNIGTGAPNAANIDFLGNSVSGYAGNGFELDSGAYTGTLDAQNNWWGSPTGPTTPNNPGGTGEEIVDPNSLISFSPFLSSGVDTQPGTPGFQGNLAITGITVVGTPDDDVVVVTATTQNSGSYVVTTNGVPGAPVPFSNITSFSAALLGDNDRLEINNPAGGLFAPINGIFYNGGGQAGDAIENLGGSATSGVYNPGPTNDAGVIIHVGAVTQTISFTGLAPATDTVAEANFTVNGTAAANAIAITNGPVAGQVTVAVDAFEPMHFANKTNVDVSGQGGGDTFTLNVTVNASGLATLDLFGHNATAAGDDDASDIVNLQAFPAAVAVLAAGQGGTDYVNNLTTLNLDPLAGPLTIDGGETAADADVARLQDSADAGPDTVVFDRTSPTVGTIAGAAGGLITYTNLEVLLFEGTAASDTINVLATLAGTNYYVTGNGGGDTVTIGNQTADFNATFDGSLDNIQGDILVTGEFNPAGPGATDTLNVDDSGTAAANNASISINPAFAFVVPAPAPGGTDTGPATELTGFAPAVIRYRHSDSTFLPPAFNNRVENLNVLSGSGADVIAVNATTATLATSINTREGNDAVTIAGDNLSAANTFSGFTGNDTFTLNIASHLGATAFAPLTAITISGNDPAANSENRDRLNINDNNAAFVRNLNYDYLDTAGDLNVLANVAGQGLAGPIVPGLTLQVRTMETIVTTSASDNDIVRVTGLSTDDDLTAVPRANGEALVFSGGNPYLEAPPISVAGFLPGLAGGGTGRGPDLRIDGIAASGLTLDGGATGGGQGNRAIVQGRSESAITTGGALDIFGFGAGVLIPGAGVGNAYDTIGVSDAQVAITGLTTINLATATFVQTTPPVPGQRPGLVVNGGDEAVAGPGGTADIITAAISTNFNIQVNGNLPNLVIAPNGQPLGDALNVTVPGAINVFSDAASPPNVTVSGVLTGPFGVSFSSIERATFTPGNGIVNIIGDNNTPGTDQQDLFVVRGQDVEFDPNINAEGVNEFSLQISGNKPGAPASLSSPVFFNGVTRINASGGAAASFDANGNAIPEVTSTLVDTLDITPYADNTPRGWGIETYFNEGDPILDGDLLIYNGVLGVSETIVVAPSAPEAGQVFSNNAATGTPIAVVNYVLNTNIIVNGSSPSGTAGDTDTLTLRGTDPANPGTSGQDRFVADFTNTGVPGDEVVVVTDIVGGANIYSLQDFSNFATVNIESLGGADAIAVTATNGLTVNVNGGLPAAGAAGVPSDSLIVNTPASVTITQGADSTTGQIITGGGAVVNYAAVEAIALISGDGGTLTVNATDDNDTIAAADIGGADLVWVNDGPAIAFVGYTALTLNGRFGSDDFSISPSGLAVASITVNGGDPTASDTLVISGTAAADTVVFTPTTNDAGSLAGLGAPVNFVTTEHVIYDGVGGPDTLTVDGTAVDDTLSFTQNLRTGSFLSSASPSFNFEVVSAVTVTGGAGGFDVAEAVGSAGIDSITTVADVVTITGPSTAGTLSLGAGVDRLLVSTLGGNDNINVSTVSVSVTVFAGDGNDTVVGSPQDDIVFGGSGDDVLVGGAGIDTQHGEDGDDLFGNLTLTANAAADDAGNDINFGGNGFDNFVWEPGDGADFNNGGDDGADILRFFGNAGDNAFTLRPGGTPTHFNALFGAVNVDNHGIEDVVVDGQGGADTFLVEDLYTTEVVSINLNLGDADAAAVDAVTVNARNVADNLLLSSAAAGTVNIQGLRYNVNLTNSEATDTLTVNANSGDDQVTVAPGVEAFAVITLNGGLGHDTLTGNVANLNGNEGNDTLVGGSGDQTMDGGAGDDTFVGNGGSDNVGGGAGSSVGDSILVAGTAGADTFNISLSATGQLIVSINGLTTTYANFIGGPIATSGIEQILVQGLAGNDTLTVDSTNGAIPIPINFDGGNNADLLILTGGVATSDTYAVGPNVTEGTSTIVIGGVTQIVRFNALEPVLDLVAGPLTVLAGDASNAINYSVGSVAANGLVTIDNFESIEFTNKTTLTIDAGNGSDTINLNNPSTPTNLTAISVIGGNPTDSDTLIANATTGNDTIGFNPSATIGAGSISINTAPVINFTTIEHAVIDGQGGTDALTHTTPAGAHQVTFTPGTAPDAGSIATRGAGGGTGLVSLTFSHIGAFGGVSFASAGGREDVLELYGTDNSDIFNVNGPTDTIQILNPQLGFVTVGLDTAGIQYLQLRALNGDDTFNLTGGLPYASGTLVDGGNPSASDILNYIGAGAAITANLAAATVTETGFAPISYLGVEHVNINAAAAATTVLGSTSNDQITVSHDVGLVTQFVRAGDNVAVRVANLGASALTLDTLEGANDADTVTVLGTAAIDSVTVTYAATTTVAVLNQQTLSIPSANLEQLTLSTLASNDSVILAGNATISTLVDAGDPQLSDTVTYTVTGGATVTQAATSTAGKVVVTDASDVDYIGVEVLSMNSSATGGATLTIQATHDNDTIAVGLVGITAAWINDGTVVRYNQNSPAFNSVIVQGRFGDDTFSVTPHAGVAITVQGGDPTASDTVLVNGTTGTDTIGVAVTGADSGTVQVNALGLVTVQTVESLKINGLAGDDALTITTPAGLHVIELADDGPLADTGTVAMREEIALGGRDLLPLSFANLGTNGTLAFADVSGTRTDELTIAARAGGSSEQFDVSTAGVVTLGEYSASLLNRQMLPVSTPGIVQLNLHAQAGDDSFIIAGNHPFTGGIFLAGGDPGASDVLTFNAAAAPVAPVALNLGTSTVVQTGFGVVAYSGVETINLNANGQALSVAATTGDDDLTVTVASATSGQIEIGLAVQQSGQVAPNVVPPLVNYSGLPVAPGNALNVIMGDGDDTLVIIGNAGAQAFDVNVTTSTVAIDDAVNGVGNDGLITYSGNESLEVFGLEGDDAFTVTVGVIPVFIDGGDPIGVQPGDSITVLGAIGFFPGPESDEGGFLSGGGTTVSFDHIESIVVIDTDDDCPFLILGTNGDDDITVIARDASYIIPPVPLPPGLDGVQDFTVSINAGPNILFVGEPDLYIDALAGDDDIVVRTPAPNGAEWNVNVRVAGGSPSIGEPNEADRLVLETPGVDNVEFRPTGADTGSLVINENLAVGYDSADDSIITFAPFTFVCLDELGNVEFTYVSSRGGVEYVEYDGEGNLDDEDNPSGIINNADDVLSIFTDAIVSDADSTTTVAPQGLGHGTFVSSFSPLFVFRSFEELIVSGDDAGFDHVIVNATEGPDTVTSDDETLFLDDPALSHRVTLLASIDQLTVNTFGGNDSIDLDLQLANLAKVIDAGAGNDNVNLSGVLIDPADPIIFGGLGDDIIVGSPNPDQIFGGFGNDTINGLGDVDDIYGEAGNDIITGGTGNDRLHGGDDFDVFQWSSGDGDDVVDGGDDGGDRIFFNGTAGNDAFTLRAGINSTELQMALLAETVHVFGVEQVNVAGAGGADSFVVNDLTPTEVVTVLIDLGSGAGSNDSVTVLGRTVSDNVAITLAAPTRVNIAGLAYDVDIASVEAADADTITFNALGGNDTVTSSDDLGGLFLSSEIVINAGLGDDFVSGFGTLNGDAGDDTLLGGIFGQTISGGTGNDLIRGGLGADTLNGNEGEDTFLHDLDGAVDSYNGNVAGVADVEFDTILFRGGSGNDTMSANQTAAATLVTTLGLVSETDTLGLTPAGTRSIDRVRLEGQSGDDTFFLTHSDTLGTNATSLDAVVFDVDGGGHFTRDRLSVQDGGTGDLLLYRKGELDSTGSISVGPGNAESLENYFSGIEFVQPITPAGGQVIVFKHDPNEWNDDRINATHLGAGQTINVDPTIDPGPFGPGDIVPPGFTPLPGDQDFYRLTPSTNGTLDIQVYFTVLATVSSGRPGLPGNGNLDIELYDADGTLIVDGVAGGVTPEFGLNDANDNERIRIPAVAGQTYFLRVFGAGVAINNYTMTIVNEAAQVPIDIELDDVIGVATVDAAPAPSATQFDATSAGAQFVLSATAGFYVGKDIVFTSGNLIGLRGRITGYLAGGTFQFAAGTFPAAPAAGSSFQIESADTGRSQFDNITRDTTPTIFLRVPNVVNVGGVATLDDLPYNGSAPGNPPDEFIGIPFVPGTALDATAPGFRVPVFIVEHGTSDQGPPNTVLAGYAQPVDPVTRPGLFTFTFGPGTLLPSELGVFDATSQTTSFFLSARVEMIDPALADQAQGYGDFAQSLEIVVDTQPPPVFFGLPNVDDDGLLPDSDSGVNPNPETLNDEITNDTTPGFFGQAEANAIIRLFVDVPEPGFPEGDGTFDPAIDFQVGFDVAEPFDGTNQYPTGYWQIDSINTNLNAAPFPIDGLRRFFITAEDVAGNISPADGVVEFEIFIDTTGPQITGVFINSKPEFLGITGATSATDTLIRFAGDNPGNILSSTAVNLGAFTLRAIDIAPGTIVNASNAVLFQKGTLFGLGTDAAGTTAQVFTINPGTGVGTPIGASFAVVASSGFGFDFNPTNLQVRITNTSNQNFAFNPVTQITLLQTALTAGADVVGSAYDRNDTDPLSPTTLYGIDSTTNNLVLQGSINGIPNEPVGGVITTVGSLGVDTSPNVGFDIAAGANAAFASLEVGGLSSLYSINLATGAASEVGLIGAGTTVFGLTALPAYDLFDPKPSTDGPTPLVNSLLICFQDLPARVQDFLYEALKLDVADTPGLYQVRGDYNGIIPIVAINVTNIAPIAGQPALATVELVFRQPGSDGVFNTSDDVGAPLPDDRYTLTVLDNIIDLANNRLDGESNASEPQEFPTFPTGDGLPGGNFVARFTVDSRPELAVWAAGSVFVDINGNTIWDPDNADFTNRDITHVMGLTSDDMFAGKFVKVNDPSDRNVLFDKLGAYGRLGTSTFRWLIDTDNDGVSDIEVFDPANINGLPVAGNFGAFAGDEVGLFTGSVWHFDTDHNFNVDTSIAWPVAGHAIVGDFDGDGVDDLGTWTNDTFSFDLSSIGAAGPVAALNNGALGTGVNGTIDRTFRFGFIGPGERPVAADMNMDGIEDVGLWMPARDGITPRGQAEWYFLVSGVTQNDSAAVPARLGPTVTGTGDPTPGSYAALPNAFYGLNSYAGGRIVADPLTPGQNIVRFQPVPFGNDQYMQFGDEFALPLVGNFDPPVTSNSTDLTNPRDKYDVTNDGTVNTLDILAIVNWVTEHGSGAVPTGGFISAPFCDVTEDSIVNTLDLLAVVNYISEQYAVQTGGQSGGEGEGDDFFTSLGSGGGDDEDDDLLGILAGGQ